MRKIYLDTHTVIYLYSGLEEKLPVGIREFLQGRAVLISPIVELEIQYLFEIGRLKEPSSKFLSGVANLFNVQIGTLSFSQVIEQTLQENWTRDVFDRIIVAQARLEDALLITKDCLIHEQYANAIWSLPPL